MNSHEKKIDNLYEKKQFKQRQPSEILITTLGYYWVVLSVILAFWQLGDSLFDFGVSLPSWCKILSVILIAIIPAVAAVLLTRFFPVFLMRINKASSDEIYFNASSEEQLQYLRSILYLSLPADDKKLLYSLNEALKDGRYDKVILIAKNNSRLFHIFNKNYLRLQNGIYAFYALCVSNKKKRDSDRQSYVKNYFLINDIGLGLIKLNKIEVKLFNDFIKDESTKLYYEAVKEEIGITDDNFTLENCKEIGLKIIKSAQEKLMKENRHYILVARAIRHKIYYSIKSNINLSLIRNYQEEFEKVKNKIKNPTDKIEVDAYMDFIDATLTNENKEATKEEIDIALQKIDSAQKGFEKNKDESRTVKCFKIKGELYLKLSNIENKEKNFLQACKAFKDGKDFSKESARYDQVLENLWQLVKNNAIDAERFAAEGLEIANQLKNDLYIGLFEKTVTTNPAA